MAKYVLIPDSFKGTLSSENICRIASEEILRLEPEAEICAIPVADGGEGTVDAFLAAVGGTRAEVPCTGPCGQEVMGFYGLLPDGTAVVEMAAAAGLPLAGACRDPEKTTTYGVGQLMAHALSRGAKRLVLGLGGSATNDGGCGAAAALGAEFLDEEGRAFVPTGGTLTQIAHIRTEGLRETLAGAEVTVMCDIDNPLCGPTGAAAVFGPQKGADAAMVARMDAGLRHLAETLEKDVGMAVLALAGGGSAGGFGAGAAAFFGGQLRMGIDVVLDLTDFDRKCRGASLVITGEGHLDSQSLRGKTVVGVARRARALGVPAAALVGGCETALDAVYAEGVSGVFPIHPALCTWPQAAARTEEDLRFTMGNLLRFMAALRR
ncbi:glycerate kinase [Dysosmobacter sp.]|uniref:glycerate kinase family protein n=2 Tax=Dysosmobacter sp. TaxID=2591382 RepID=UPI003A9415A8